MPRPRTELEPHVAPTAAEHAAGDVIYCDGCSLSWATRFAVPRLKKCRNCARTFWRESQKAHRLGAEVRDLQECGIFFDGFEAIAEGDIVECYEMEELERTL